MLSDSDVCRIACLTASMKFQVVLASYKHVDLSKMIRSVCAVLCQMMYGARLVFFNVCCLVLHNILPLLGNHAVHVSIMAVELLSMDCYCPLLKWGAGPMLAAICD